MNKCKQFQYKFILALEVAILVVGGNCGNGKFLVAENPVGYFGCSSIHLIFNLQLILIFIAMGAFSVSNFSGCSGYRLV